MVYYGEIPKSKLHTVRRVFFSKESFTKRKNLLIFKRFCLRIVGPPGSDTSCG